MRLLRAVATISSFTGLSRISGLAREILMSYILGAGIVTDAFIVAFRFPNFFRRLFAEGALHAAFVPLFSRKMTKHGIESARQTAEQVFSVLALVLSVLVLIVLIATPSLMFLIAPGFGRTSERLQLAIDFTRLTFPYILFISLGALMTGMLNSIDRFAAGAAAPILLNVTMIASLLIYSFFDISPGYALSLAVLIAGVAQFLWLYIACWRAGLHLHMTRPRLTPDVKKVMMLMIPGAFGAGVMQINLFFDMMLASFLPTGSLSYLYYADRLNQLPLSMFGIAIGTALLPKLSKLLHSNNQEKAMATQESAIEIALQLSIPAMIGLMVLSYPLISLIYGHGKFSTQDVLATAPTLAVFALGLPAYVLGKVLTVNFFAHHDTRTPVKIAMVSVAVNLGLTLVFMGPFLHVGMAMATSISSWCTVVMLFLSLRKRGSIVLSSRLVSLTLRVIFVSAVMGLGIWLLGKWLAPPQTIAKAIWNLSLGVGTGLGLFFFCGHWFGAFDIHSLRQSIRRT
ncbi:MAG: murein biosynthesis integral membrane protein MurJ [Alphaproteobacteria bacterium]